MSYATDRINFVIRLLLLMICCALFMPHGVETGKKNVMDASIRTATMTLAITGINNPVAQLKTFAEPRLTAQNSPAKRGQQPVQNSFDDTSTPFTIPSEQPQPQAVLSSSALSNQRASLPVSHGIFNWFALAPPASRNI